MVQWDREKIEKLWKWIVAIAMAYTQIYIHQLPCSTCSKIWCKCTCTMQSIHIHHSFTFHTCLIKHVKKETMQQSLSCWHSNLASKQVTEPSFFVLHVLSQLAKKICNQNGQLATTSNKCNDWQSLKHTIGRECTMRLPTITVKLLILKSTQSSMVQHGTFTKCLRAKATMSIVVLQWLGQSFVASISACQQDWYNTMKELLASNCWQHGILQLLVLLIHVIFDEENGDDFHSGNQTVTRALPWIQQFLHCWWIGFVDLPSK